MGTSRCFTHICARPGKRSHAISTKAGPTGSNNMADTLIKVFDTVKSTINKPSAQNCQQPCTKDGWLYKQGGVVKSWHRRWFTLNGDQLFYYSKKEDTRPLGVISLTGNRAVELPPVLHEPDKFHFEIAPGGDRDRMTTTHETYPLCASSDAERKEWLRDIRKVMFAHLGGAIFGTSLTEVLKYEQKKGARKVPAIVEQCVEYLVKYGLEVEGIFRLPGRCALLREMKESYDSGCPVNFTEDESADIHTVASLLKMYLRELPEALIPGQFYESVIKVVNRDMHQDPKSALQRLSTLLCNVPRENYNLMKYLSQFLHSVTQYSKENKMSGMNLATVFVNAYLRPEDDDPALLMGTAAGRTQVTFVLITECEAIFTMEYTSSGSSVKIGSLLDIDDNGSTVANPEPFNPTASFNSHQAKPSRVSRLLYLSSEAENLPHPLAPVLEPNYATVLDEKVPFDDSFSPDADGHIYADVFDSQVNVFPTPKPRSGCTLSESASVKENSRADTDEHMNNGTVEVDNSNEAPVLPPKPPPRPSRSSSLPRGVSSVLEPVDIQTDFLETGTAKSNEEGFHPDTNDGLRKLSPRRRAPTLPNSLHRRSSAGADLLRNTRSSSASPPKVPPRPRPSGIVAVSSEPNSDDDSANNNSSKSKKALRLSASLEDYPYSKSAENVAVDDAVSMVNSKTMQQNSTLKSSTDSIDCLGTDNNDDARIAELANTNVHSMDMDSVVSHVNSLIAELLHQHKRVKELTLSLQSHKLQHKSKMQDMAQKLNEEKSATAEAVDRVVSVQTQLHKYQHIFGPIAH